MTNIVFGFNVIGNKNERNPREFAGEIMESAYVFYNWTRSQKSIIKHQPGNDFFPRYREMKIASESWGWDLENDHFFIVHGNDVYHYLDRTQGFLQTIYDYLTRASDDTEPKKWVKMDESDPMYTNLAYENSITTTINFANCKCSCYWCKINQCYNCSTWYKTRVKTCIFVQSDSHFEKYMVMY